MDVPGQVQDRVIHFLLFIILIYKYVILITGNISVLQILANFESLLKLVFQIVESFTLCI